MVRLAYIAKMTTAGPSIVKSNVAFIYMKKHSLALARMPCLSPSLQSPQSVS